MADYFDFDEFDGLVKGFVANKSMGSNSGSSFKFIQEFYKDKGDQIFADFMRFLWDNSYDFKKNRRYGVFLSYFDIISGRNNIGIDFKEFGIDFFNDEFVKNGTDFFLSFRDGSFGENIGIISGLCCKIVLNRSIFNMFIHNMVNSIYDKGGIDYSDFKTNVFARNSFIEYFAKGLVMSVSHFKEKDFICVYWTNKFISNNVFGLRFNDGALSYYDMIEYFKACFIFFSYYEAGDIFEFAFTGMYDLDFLKRIGIEFDI